MRRWSPAVVLATAAILAAFAPSASAAPAWRFNGAELAGSETIVGDAVFSTLTIPGLTIKCKKMHYEMEISNSMGTGAGLVEEFTFFTCLTSSQACTVDAISASQLPWAVKLTKVSSTNYLVFTGVEIDILFGGPTCVLNEFEIPIEGCAGAAYDNAFEVFTFSAASSKATGCKLNALGEGAEWNGAFTTEATGAHSGEALTIG